MDLEGVSLRPDSHVNGTKEGKEGRRRQWRLILSISFRSSIILILLLHVLGIAILFL